MFLLQRKEHHDHTQKPRKRRPRRVELPAWRPTGRIERVKIDREIFRPGTANRLQGRGEDAFGQTDHGGQCKDRQKDQGDEGQAAMRPDQHLTSDLKNGASQGKEGKQCPAFGPSDTGFDCPLQAQPPTDMTDPKCDEHHAHACDPKPNHRWD